MHKFMESCDRVAGTGDRVTGLQTFNCYFIIERL